MLHEFLQVNRMELMARCRGKVAARASPAPTATELAFGVPVLIDQLVEMLRAEHMAGPTSEPAVLTTDIGRAAAKHGAELLHKGFTVDQVVHDYGDLCQALTELARERHEPISVDEFHTFNRCLDNAIAEAVSEFGRQRDQVISGQGAATDERLGSLAHELRNLLATATLAYSAIKGGHGAVMGATGAVLGRSLDGLRDLIDRALTGVRQTSGQDEHRGSISLDAVLGEVRVAAKLDADARKLAFTVSVEAGLSVVSDRQMLASALTNLLQNAFKFTRPGGHVSLTAHAVADRVLIDVADQCGGLPGGRTEELFLPFTQRGGDRSGLGLGLSISRRAVEANGGTLRVRDVPGTGCVFTIDLPRTGVVHGATRPHHHPDNR
jgi:signal transduction histidine kinase